MTPKQMNLEGKIVTAPDGARSIFALPDGKAIPIHPIIAGMPFTLQQAYAQGYADAWGQALELQGEAAFDHSKMSAAIHEAGHLVIGTLDGFPMVASRIWRPRGSRAWVGTTESKNRDMRLGLAASGEENRIAARQVMAGYMAERVLEGDAAREGSNLDKRVTAFFLTSWAAQAFGRDEYEVHNETEQAVGETLARHGDTVHKIAKAIAGSSPLKLKGKRLGLLLAPLGCDASI